MPSAIAGRESVTRLIQSSCMETSGVLCHSSMAAKTVMPIAQPMSAALSAGASLTPSPVMETTWPLRCQALTMRILFSGETRA